MKLNINSPIFQFLGMLYDFILLNILFILSCLPLFTIGTSITALYYVTMQEARMEHGYIFKSYIKSWKQNFVQSTLIWGVFFTIGSILFFNLIFWNNPKNLVGTIIFVLMVIGSVIYVICFIYIFPLLARFKNTIKQTLQNAFLISLQNLKTTILLLLMNGLFIFLCVILPWSKIFMVLLGFSFFAYCNSFLLIRVFKQYEPEEDHHEIQ